MWRAFEFIELDEMRTTAAVLIPGTAEVQQQVPCDRPKLRACLLARLLTIRTPYAQWYCSVEIQQQYGNV